MHFQRRFVLWMRWWSNSIYECEESKVSNVNLFWKSKGSFDFFFPVLTLCVFWVPTDFTFDISKLVRYLNYEHKKQTDINTVSTTFPAFTGITGPGSYWRQDFSATGGLCSCLNPFFFWSTFLPHFLHIQFTYSEKKLSGNTRDKFIPWGRSFTNCRKQGSCRKSTK